MKKIKGRKKKIYNLYLNPLYLFKCTETNIITNKNLICFHLGFNVFLNTIKISSSLLKNTMLKLNNLLKYKNIFCALFFHSQFPKHPYLSRHIPFSYFYYIISSHYFKYFCNNLNQDLKKICIRLYLRIMTFRRKVSLFSFIIKNKDLFVLLSFNFL